MRAIRPPIPAVERFAPLGFCLYCGRKPPQVALTDEHIVPLSFGGHRILPDASCVDCAKVTSDICERVCATSLRSLRIHQDYSSRHKARDKKRPAKRIKVAVPGATGVPEIIEKPGSDVSGLVVLPFFQPPTIISGHTGSPPLIIPYFAATAPEGVGEPQDPMAYGEVNGDAFARILAQIALGWSMCRGGIVSDDCPLPDIVLGKGPGWDRWIGGLIMNMPSLIGNKDRYSSFCQLEPMTLRIHGRNFRSVQIRLFPYLDPPPPIYTVIIRPCELSPGDAAFAVEMLPSRIEVDLWIDGQITHTSRNSPNGDMIQVLVP